MATNVFSSNRHNVEMTAREFSSAAADFLAEGLNFRTGPYLYSIGVVERGVAGHVTDPSYLYHATLYNGSRDEQIDAIESIVRTGALLDVSMCRAGHAAEHKLVRIIPAD